MHKIEEALWSDYDIISGQLKSLSQDDDNYGKLLKERDDIRQELVRLEQLKNERNINIKQIETNNKQDIVRNIISLTNFVLTSALSFYTIKKTFKFDEKMTITSTLGRNAVNGAIPKIGKR